jgi:hypothetical protein
MAVEERAVMMATMLGGAAAGRRSSRIGQLGNVDSGERIRHIAAEGREPEGIIN